MSTKPEYQGGSIVNLMRDIAEASGVSTPYAKLSSTHLANLQDSENIVLMIIDGLGYNYLQKHGSGSILRKSLKDSMTSVFLPSTGSAITTFLTGLAPQQHAITGWYVHLPEYGLVSRYLPFTNMIDGNLIGIPISNTIDVDPLLPRMNRKVFSVMGNRIIDSVYTRYMTGTTQREGYTGSRDFFRSIERAISTPGRTYTHAYWPELDSIAHLLGVGSAEAIEHLQEFTQMLDTFLEQQENTTFILTGDHGFNDTREGGVIYMHDHPLLQDLLTLPVCGDTRTAFCYVKPSQIAEFERYVEKNLADSCDIYESQKLIDEGWFGLFDVNRRLRGRVGDFTLVCKEGHAIVNSFPGIEPYQLKGHHGGMCEDEMLVPLIVIDV
ncbi:MAG: alkaline phosphatase family protein [Candidatus Thorarchaeota archaeon]